MQQQPTASTSDFKPRLWVPGDWNAFFGLGTNVLLNVLVLSSLVLFVIKLPNDVVFGRVLPIRGFTPRAAMLGTLAGIWVAFISMGAAFEMWNAAWIALATFAIVMLSWTAGVRLPLGIPGGLAAIIVGTIIGWLSYFVFG